MARLRLLGNRVLVAPITPRLEMPEGLVAPDIAEPVAEVTGTVVDVGIGYDGPPITGKVVCFSSTAGLELVFEGQRFLAIPMPEILATLT